MKIIMVFGSDGPDLDRSLTDVTNVGEDTRVACDTAVRCWLESKDGSMFVVTAGAYKPNGHNNEILLGARMADYIYSECRKVSAREAKVIHERADTFDTIGEARALGSVAQKLIRMSRLRADSLVIVAKNWHMKRCKWLATHFLKHNGVDLIISEEPYSQPRPWPWWIIQAEGIKLLRDKIKARSS